MISTELKPLITKENVLFIISLKKVKYHQVQALCSDKVDLNFLATIFGKDDYFLIVQSS